MKRKTLLVLLIGSLFCSKILAQTYCDTTNQEGMVNLFYVTEIMPEPNLTTTELENLLNSSIHLENYSNLPEKIRIAFIINCKGEDFGYEFHDTIDQELQNNIQNILKTKLKWTPGFNFESPVDFAQYLIFIIDNDQFRIGNWEEQKKKKKKKRKK